MKVAILWHMHQPSYWEADLRRYRYPWAFLHAVRHYHMMGVAAKEHPEVAMTINVTPVLAEQLLDYSQADFKDKILDSIRKPADSLDGDDIRVLLDHAFKLNVPTMIAPYPRYRELRNVLEGTSSARVRIEEIRDLQVWYLLTWTGTPLRRRPEVAELFRKGKRFSEEEKSLLFGVCHQAVKEVLPLYRELQDRGRVEVSTTPYYHPILPLLIDCEVARESRSNVHLEGVCFRFPQDARWHVEEAVRAHEGIFGKPPRGMWPAEGSVSDSALELLSSCGMKWAATDEAVLCRSLGRFPLSEEEKHQSYGFSETGLQIFFRDRELSDRVGFVYSSWNPRQAADDVCDRLLQIRTRLGRRSASACVSIILDGENPWEYYPDSGAGFLSRLYDRLAATPGLESTSMGAHAAAEPRPARLSHVVPGSWIDANFDTWIGCHEKNRAWTFLSNARQKLALSAPHEKVPREFYRAEGSDWFWWLGPGHDTPYEASYENLFRTNLLEGLARLGIEAPPVLKVAARIVTSPRFQPPLHLFTPRIDGRLGNYYGWIAAGFYRSSEGSIHRSERLLERVRFGFDETTFYLRAEGKLRALQSGKAGVSLVLEFLRPRNLKVVYRDGVLRVLPRSANGNGGGNPGGSAGARENGSAGAMVDGSGDGMANGSGGAIRNGGECAGGNGGGGAGGGGCAGGSGGPGGGGSGSRTLSGSDSGGREQNGRVGGLDSTSASPVAAAAPRLGAESADSAAKSSSGRSGAASPGCSGVGSVGVSEAEPGTESGAQAAGRSEAQAGGKSEAHAPGKSEAQAPGKSEAQAPGKSGTESGGKPEAVPVGKSEAKPGGGPETERVEPAEKALPDSEAACAGISRGVAAIGSVAEAGLPLEELGAQPGDVLDFAVTIQMGQNTLDRLPQSGYITVTVPTPDYGGENWSV